MARYKRIKKQMDTKQKPRLNRQKKQFCAWGAFDLRGGLLTGGGAIGLSPLKANELEEDKGKLSWTGYLPHVEINGTSMKF